MAEPGSGSGGMARPCSGPSKDANSVCRQYQLQLAPPGCLQPETALLQRPSMPRSSLWGLASLPPCSAVCNTFHEFLGCCGISVRVNSPPVHSISVCVSCLLIPGYLNQVNPTAVQVTEKDTEGMKLSRGTAPW